MQAITLKHPWAFAIARLGKRVENRTWKPPNRLLGQRIAIHGGAIPKGAVLREWESDIVWTNPKRFDSKSIFARSTKKVSSGLKRNRISAKIAVTL